MTADLVTPETREVDPLMEYDMLITDEVDFGVELRVLDTYRFTDEPMRMAEHKATVRINHDGSEVPLWVVGSKYQVVDHREVIKMFALALDKASLTAEVEHHVYKDGCRIFSMFTLNKEYEIPGSAKKAQPFFALTTSHDGSLKVGFLMGAKIGETYLNVSKTVYGASALHTKGLKIETMLDGIGKAVEVFTTQVIPMWDRMGSVNMKSEDVKKLIEKAISSKVLSKRAALDLDFVSVDGTGRSAEIVGAESMTVWQAYTKIAEHVSKVPFTKKGEIRKGATEEKAFWRNVDASEFFTKLMDHDMTGLKKIVGEDLAE
jgi:hypothetical protein